MMKFVYKTLTLLIINCMVFCPITILNIEGNKQIIEDSDSLFSEYSEIADLLRKINKHALIDKVHDKGFSCYERILAIITNLCGGWSKQLPNADYKYHPDNVVCCSYTVQFNSDYANVFCLTQSNNRSNDYVVHPKTVSMCDAKLSDAPDTKLSDATNNTLINKSSNMSAIICFFIVAIGAITGLLRYQFYHQDKK